MLHVYVRLETWWCFSSRLSVFNTHLRDARLDWLRPMTIACYLLLVATIDWVVWCWYGLICRVCGNLHSEQVHGILHFKEARF